jgi:GNAT superfamily N-acetyltransferase
MRTEPMLKAITASGQAIEPYLMDLGRLRITVFAEYPYLYHGDLDYEQAYLSTYLQTSESFVFALYSDQQMIGATTCLPLKSETADIKQPFEHAGLDTDGIFYFGESILLPHYRGLGFGHRFFDERESFARSLGSYHTTCFCSVERPIDHPLRPAGYRSNDAFWLKRGYQKQSDLYCQMTWKDSDQASETAKKLIFWTKSWK